MSVMYSIRFNKAAYRVLEDLEDKCGRSKAEILTQSLAILDYCVDAAINSGYGLALVDLKDDLKKDEIKQYIRLPILPEGDKAKEYCNRMK